MSEQLATFVANIIKNLETNGYPAKRVALPLERMYAVAYEKGLNFNKALDSLAAQGISHEKTDTKVIFFPKAATEAATSAAGQPDFATMMAQAQEMMKQMTPEQLKAMQDMVANMSDDERQDLMKKARDMGFSP